MKSLRCMIAVAALAFTMPAHAAVGGPPIIIYRASGVIDTESGFATAVFCTNVSGVTETLTVVVRGPTSTIAANVSVNVPHFNTVILATRDTQLFSETTNMATGVINAGVVSIAATSVNVFCTVNVVQWANSSPLMTPLHLLRLSPISGSEE